MAYRFRLGETTGDAVRRIATEQIDRALGELGDEGLDRDRTIHQIRKRCKKLRGLVRLVRPALGKTYPRANACFRDAARLVSAARDAHTRVVAFDQLLSRYRGEIRVESFAELREAVATSPAVDPQGSLVEGRLAEFETRFRQARREVEGWRIDGDGFAPIAAGLRKTYGRGRRAMTVARSSGNTADYHDWRKRVKYHGYHLRLLRPLWPPLLVARRQEVDRLGDCLGDDHDLAVLRQTILELPKRLSDSAAAELLLGLLDRRRSGWHRRAAAIGGRLYGEPSEAMVGRLESYWDVWQAGRNMT